MDLTQTIIALRRELKSLDTAIATLEALAKAQSASPIPKKSTRGRKSMDADERVEVSARMKKYWASRHFGKFKAKSTEPETTTGGKSLDGC